MKGILFCDIDGTLIPYGDKEMKPSLLATLQEAIRKDWMLCIATGRVYASVRQTLPMLEESTFFSCSSGACLYYQGREAMPSAFLDRTTVDELVQTAKEFHCSAIFSVPEGLYAIGPLFPYTDNLFKKQHTVPKSVANTCQFPSDRVCVCTFQFPQEMKIPMDELRGRWRGKLFWEQGGPCLVDAARSDKGRAVKQVLDYFHIPREHSYAFGDYDNDIPMLRAVGHGYLMSDTGRKELLDVFPRHCDDIEATIREIISR
ncbi:MAG: HAD family hydrolase [Sphaerochaetaceae bacterium]|nr:HAD family hydrolase [Spirochaetales bacterium]MDY5500854.1 HAD family hydrolase [Sphaerochaetaceae bacterium]